jgi:hypothetical protein
MREDNQWFVELGNDQKASADTAYIRRSMEHFSNLPVVRAIDTPKLVWDALGVGDTGTVVKIYVSGKPQDSLIVGRLEFFNTSRAHFYVRRQGDNHIYIVDKYLFGSFAAPQQEIRNKTMVTTDPGAITAIHILSANGNPVTLQIQGGQWTVNGRAADRQAILNYLTLVGNLRSNNFSKKPETGADYSIIVNGVNGQESGVKVYRTEDGYVMESTVNKGNYLKLTNDQFAKLFPAEEYFLAK